MSRILLVEDHNVVREPLARLLRLEGFVTVCAANGVDALAALEREPIDLVLCDLMMPKKDGVSLLEAIRADDRWRDLPVIILTGVVEGSLLERAKALNVAHVLAKAKFSVDEVFACIRESLPRNGRQGGNTRRRTG